MKKNFLKYQRLMFGLLLFLVMLYAAISAIPSRHIKIAAGPIGGSFYEIALQYQKLLKEKGYRVEIVPFANTDEIAASLADRRNQFDVGFVANGLEGKNSDALISLGEIQLQPIFIFSNNDSLRAHPILSAADLRGMNLVLPPEKSVTSQTLVSIFSLYGIDHLNTRINFLDLGEGVAELKQGKFDAGLFILAADNDSVADLANDKKIALVQLAEQQAIVKKLPFLKDVTLPDGVFNLPRDIPSRQVNLLAASISLAARKDLPSATTYALLEAMREVHRKSSYVNGANEFPKYSDSDSDSSSEDRISAFYKNGTPWIFSHFPTAIASIVDAYLAPLLGLWFFLSIFGVIGQLEKIRHLFSMLAAYAVLIWIRRRMRKGQASPERNRYILEKIKVVVTREHSGIASLLREIETLQRE